MPLLTLSSSSTAADLSKSVVTPEAPEEEMDISFTEKDQPAPQLHINKKDKPNTDSSMKKDKKRKKKKSRQDQSHKADQSSTPEKGKTLGRTDKQSDIYERKERERYQVVIEQPPDDMNTTTLALKENISSLIQRDIRMFKEVKLPDGSRKIIGYLSTWDNMKECIDTPMIWNGAQLK
ncbi:hypothetical protein GLOIN_2v1662849 [Rhizophagus clarus]|uniref:Uncharacterized protein n=1 Tax=Rhizophagus clarus TaxID=94130 RepID=A0A8H3LXA0_9GLOM|nr:hypothetical protein GLOIN_2v1662849 [Rhizophagus clarus]